MLKDDHKFDFTDYRLPEESNLPAPEQPYRDVTPKPERRWLPGFLFVTTFLTTTFAGAIQQGVHPVSCN